MRWLQCAVAESLQALSALVPPHAMNKGVINR
jgi:hypothetical protein